MGEVTRVGISPRELVMGVTELASPPDVYNRLSALIDSGKSSIEEISDTLQEDPGLTARLLKIVNSAFYGFPSSVSSVKQAVNLIGLKELKDLVLTTVVMEMFRGIPNELVNMHTFWRGSLRCAVFCKVFASYHQNPKSIESIFTSGMLHDIGHLIIYHKIPEIARKALLEQIYQEREIYEVEQELWGFDYSSVGSELLKLWKLPRILVQSVGQHNRPIEVSEFPTETSILHISSRIARMDEYTPELIDELIPSQSPVWKLAGIRREILVDVLEQAEKQYQESLAILV